MIEENERRKFLQKCFQLSMVVPVIGLFLASCSSSKKKSGGGQAKAAAKKSPCEDMTGVDAAELDKRKALGYSSLSPIQDKQCDNCKLWIPAKEGKDCGGCMLFAGPVSPEGHCTYWAPQV